MISINRFPLLYPSQHLYPDTVSTNVWTLTIAAIVFPGSTPSLYQAAGGHPDLLTTTEPIGLCQIQTDMHAAVPVLLSALDESFHCVLPSTVSAPILDSKPGQAAELRAELISVLALALKFFCAFKNLSFHN